ncbi:MAG: RNase P subunit p30 family protein [Candidatus Methanomethylicia archaeon]
MRRYVDLCVFLTDVKNIDEMLVMAKHLGYHTISLTLTNDNIISSEIINEIKKIAIKNKLNIVFRYEINTNDSKKLREKVRKIWRKYEIISAYCIDKKIARIAGRDSRINILIFPLDTTIKDIFNDAQCSLMKAKNQYIEIRYAEIAKNINLERTYTNLLRWVRIAYENKIPIIASSGANRPQILRSPFEIASILVSSGLDIKSARDSISTTPMKLIEQSILKTRGKLINKYVKILRSPLCIG